MKPRRPYTIEYRFMKRLQGPGPQRRIRHYRSRPYRHHGGTRHIKFPYLEG
jgi:hypothetical protein